MRGRGLAGLALATLIAGRAQIAEGSTWRVARGEVRVLCPLTVGGSFEAKTTSLTGALTPASTHPAMLVGTLVVDVRTLDSGIGLRDEHLRNTYLEVGRGEGFDTAVLSNIDLGGVTETFQGRTRFTAELLIHGVKKAVAGQAEVRREGPGVRVDAGFPVTLADFGIAKPRYLGVGVKDDVQVRVSLVATAAAESR
jgi:hypothetical protein